MHSKKGEIGITDAALECSEPQQSKRKPILQCTAAVWVPCLPSEAARAAARSSCAACDAFCFGLLGFRALGFWV